VTGYHELVTARGDWLELGERDQAITRAEEGYRTDPGLGRNLEVTLWTAERRAAALAGEAVALDPDQVRHSGPVLDLDKITGQCVTQPQVSVWGEFAALHAQVDAARTQLLGAIHAEIANQAAEREVEILDGVPTMQVQDLAQAAAELTLMVTTLAACRAAAGIRARHGALRERISSLDVFLAAASKAAGDEYTLLGPVEQPRRRLATGSHGLDRDEPRTASPLPPAGVVLKGG
jgi:hypothetical protein